MHHTFAHSYRSVSVTLETTSCHLLSTTEDIHADQGAHTQTRHLLRLTPRGGSGDEEQLPRSDPSIGLLTVQAG